uniref:F-box domain-containing protein n=1 Tax=Opuntia streptacantha TaxID=393608 RepID=A0A7C8ZQV4_OPUST
MASATAEDSSAAATSATAFPILHPDIIRSHILPRLDGCSLAAVGCATPELRSLCSDVGLWSHKCYSTWPSTTMPRMRELISTFTNGPRSFFSLSYPLFPTLSPILYPPSLPSRLVSAVDIFYRGRCIFSTVHETETVTGWFRCSPFRVDLLGPKETVATPIRRPSHDDTCRDLIGDLELSWIVVDPSTCKAVNVSSFRPVSVERHWLSGEVHVRYAAVAGHVMCGVEVTCVGGMGPVMHVTEVSLKMEDLDGVHLTGRESLVILQRGFEGKRGNGGGKREREEEGRRRYVEYLERKREITERKRRREGTLDMLCVGLGVAILAALFFLLCSSR